MRSSETIHRRILCASCQFSAQVCEGIKLTLDSWQDPLKVNQKSLYCTTQCYLARFSSDFERVKQQMITNIEIPDQNLFDYQALSLSLSYPNLLSLLNLTLKSYLLFFI